MKKGIFSILLCLAVAVCLAGFQAGAVSSEASGRPDAAVQAQESGEEISAEKLEAAETERRERVSACYAIYSEFGLWYNQEEDRFFYEGQIVRHFSDVIDSENTNGFHYEDGTIDLKAVRDEDGALIGLEAASDEEFAARTARQNQLNAAAQAAGMEGNNGCIELGNPVEADDSLRAYADFGVSYDTASQKWLYDGQEIYFFYDPAGETYIDYSAAGGISLQVTWDKNGDATGLYEIPGTEAKKIVES